MTLVLHLALPEELTLPLVVLLAIVVVLDLQIPLGPLLYFVSPIFLMQKLPMEKIISLLDLFQMVALGVCLLYELPPIIGILIHVHLVVLLIIRLFAIYKYTMKNLLLRSVTWCDGQP